VEEPTPPGVGVDVGEPLIPVFSPFLSWLEEAVDQTERLIGVFVGIKDVAVGAGTRIGCCKLSVTVL
jgi:hypothetical protein